MAGEIIRLGDSTSHGGKVLEGSQTNLCYGKPVALIGHKVSCPKCRGTPTIVEGVQTATLYGKGVALAGMKTSCGATLIASQFTAVVIPGGGGGEGGAAPADTSSRQAAAAKSSSAAGGASANTAADAGGTAGASAEKSIKRIWWSYGEQATPVENFSRHYVDLNIHVETENYASGESVPVSIRNDDGSELAAGIPELALNVAVGADGSGKAMNVFAGKTVTLGTWG